MRSNGPNSRSVNNFCNAFLFIDSDFYLPNTPWSRLGYSCRINKHSVAKNQFKKLRSEACLNCFCSATCRILQNFTEGAYIPPGWEIAHNGTLSCCTCHCVLCLTVDEAVSVFDFETRCHISYHQNHDPYRACQDWIQDHEDTREHCRASFEHQRFLLSLAVACLRFRDVHDR